MRLLLVTRLEFTKLCFVTGASQVMLVVKNLPANAGDVRDLGSIHGSGRSPGGGHGNPLQYSCQESPHGQRSLGANSRGWWWTGKPGVLQSMELQRVRQDWTDSTQARGIVCLYFSTSIPFRFLFALFLFYGQRRFWIAQSLKTFIF